MFNAILSKLTQKVVSHIEENKNKRFADYLERDIRIYPDSSISKYTTIDIGTNITGSIFIASFKEAPVTIGKYCAIASNVRIRPLNHYTGYINLQRKFQKRYHLPSLDSIKGAVVIGNNVWIGDNVIILSGVTVGDGAVIGAGSVVTKNIPPYSIAVGNPAKPIKKRFSEQIIEQIIDIEWWNWSEDKIKRNQAFFETDLSTYEELDISKLIID